MSQIQESLLTPSRIERKSSWADHHKTVGKKKTTQKKNFYKISQKQERYIFFKGVIIIMATDVLTQLLEPENNKVVSSQ